MGRAKNIHVNADYCKGCDICVDVCPRGVLEISTDLSKRGVYPPRVRDLSLCTGCKICELHCPDFAIAIELRGENGDDCEAG